MSKEGDILAELDSDIRVDDAPYISNITFEELVKNHGLSPVLLDNIYAKGFKRPSKIQAAALPFLLSKDKDKRNLIAQGQSGTGKTATYVLGMLNIVDPKKPDFKAVCLESSRELARQTFDICEELSKGTNVPCKCLISGTDLKKGVLLKELVFVATPGFMRKAIQLGCINPKNILMLAIDEADAMLQDDLGEQTLRIKGDLNPGAKIALFSATYPDEVRDFAEKIVPNAIKITLKPSEVMLNRINLLKCYTTEKFDKYQIVYSLLRSLSIGQAIIFTNTIRTCEEISRRLSDDGFPVSKLHGELERDDRDKVIDTFRRGNSRYLVSTNVVARGIDILQVSLVVNFDIPVHKNPKEKKEETADSETFIHRVGRTARFGRSGVALSLISSKEEESILDEIFCLNGIEAEEIKPEDLGEIEKKLEECRKKDEENLRRFGLEAALPSLDDAKESIVPQAAKKGNRKKGGKPKKSKEKSKDKPETDEPSETETHDEEKEEGKEEEKKEESK